jgi:FKBP-type peptidyl-prolyl cis-trans isomerase SlyD
MHAAQIISFNCTLKNKAGQVISSTYNHDVLTALQEENLLLSGLAHGLQNIKKGEKRNITVEAEKAYGLYDPKKVFLYPRKKLSRDTLMAIGTKVVIISKSGRACDCRVAQVHGDMVSLDANHPLAGQDLVFEIETLSARDATIDEISVSSNMLSTQYFH